MARSKARGPMETQSVVLLKERFRTKRSAASWVRKHGFVSSKVDSTPNTWRFRQDAPEAFFPKTFRTKTIDDGVELVLAKRRNGQMVTAPGNSRAKAKTKGIAYSGSGLWFDGKRWTK